jgi:hypothetical protein
MKKIKTLIRKTILSIILLACIYGLNYLFTKPEIVENVFARGISRFINGSVSIISNLVPFSLAEVVIYLFTFYIVITIIRIIRNIFKLKLFKTYKLIHSTVNFLLLISIVSTVMMGALYYREDSFNYLGLTSEITLDDNLAKETAIYYVEYLKTASTGLERDENSNVISPYTISELNDMIAVEYKELSANNDYFASYYNRVKPVTFSLGLSYLGILGVYFPFTAEANVNANTFTYEYHQQLLMN